MDVKFSIVFHEDGKRFFGEGPYLLLLGIEKYGSLKASAEDIGMAYTKAITLIKRAEKFLGFPLTQRSIGGVGGGGSTLTRKAREFIKIYETYQQTTKKMAEELYYEFFSEFWEKESLDHRK